MNDCTWKKRCGRRLKSLREIHEETNVWGVICSCHIIGGSRKLGNKKQEKRVTQLRIK